MNHSARTFRILCLDGGGIRGAFTSSVLRSIEDRVLGGRSLIDNCDLIAGTSTGALIALALAFGVSPQKTRDFFRERGQRIFGSGTPLYRWPRRVRQLFGAPYSSITLEEEIEALIGKVRFGDAAKRLVLPSYNADLGNVHIFKHLFATDRDLLSSRGYSRNLYDRFDNLSAAEAGAASSAAPTFFPAKLVTSDESHFFIDGGIWANSPVLPAIAEAIGPLGIELDRIRVLSVGTRFEKMPIGRWKRVGGFMPWNVGVINLLMNAQAAGSIGTARWILRDQRFLRLDDQQDPRQDHANVPMSLDDVRSIDKLIERGEDLVDREYATIGSFLHDWHDSPAQGAA